MYGPTDLKKGRVIVVDGKPYQVVEYQQKVMGRGGSIVNVRIKNLIDGSVLSKTYKGPRRIPPLLSKELLILTPVRRHHHFPTT